MRKSKPIGGIGSERKKNSARNSICLVWDLFEQQARRFRRVFQRRSHLPSDQRELIEIWDLVAASPSLLPPPPSSPSSLHPRGCRFSIFFCSLPFHILSVSSCCLSSSCLSTLQSLESCGTIAKNNTKRFQLSIIISCAFYYFDGYLLLTNNGCHTLGYVFKTNIFPEKTNIRLWWLCAFFSASMWVDDGRCVLGTTSIETPG